MLLAEAETPAQAGRLGNRRRGERRDLRSRVGIKAAGGEVGYGIFR